MSYEDEAPSEDMIYACKTDDITTCPATCIGLENCEACECALVDREGGPWGKAVDVIFCLSPIIFLLVVTLKPNPLPTTVSLPMAALILLMIRLMYLGSDPEIVFSSVILGVHEALSPLTIMFGAMLLFETMESTLCLPFVMREMKVLTKGHTIAELIIIFSFAYMVEGASGFGTPAALGAPMLASLGYPKFESVVTLLLMNTFATVWGAAGTPIWFGFGNLGLSQEEFIQISFKACTALFVAAYLIFPTLVLTKICNFRILLQNWLFIVLGTSAVMIPTFGFSFVSYEFPALVGGMVGCCLNSIIIYFEVGLKDFANEDVKREEGFGKMDFSTTASFSISTLYRSSIVQKDYEEKTMKDNLEEGEALKKKKPVQNSVSQSATEHFLGERKEFGIGYIKDVIGRTFPLWGVVMLLVLTRIPQIGIKGVLTAKDPAFEIFFGTYGEFRCSASLVLQLNNILTYPGINWKYELLYIPFIMPFVIVSIITMLIYRKDLKSPPKDIFLAVLNRLVNPSKALMGALILVQLLIKEGPASPSSLIGNTLANAFKSGWIAIAAFVGALGSFFSGSTTVSNLTFGAIQKIAALKSGTSVTAMLALQVAGASAGNGICLNNIIAACAVVGLNIGEGKVIQQTAISVVSICIVATLIMLVYLFN